MFASVVATGATHTQTIRIANQRRTVRNGIDCGIKYTNAVYIALGKFWIGYEREWSASANLRKSRKFWWASRESNTAPTDYESAALTKHELEALKSVRRERRLKSLTILSPPSRTAPGTKWREDTWRPAPSSRVSYPRGKT